MPSSDHALLDAFAAPCTENVKVILITGASRGIGAAIASHLLASSSSVRLVLVARSRAPLEAFQRAHGAERVQIAVGDVGRTANAEESGGVGGQRGVAFEAVKLALATWGRLDGVVLNHGVLEPVRRVEDLECEGVEEWERCMKINFLSCVEFIRLALPALKNNHGRILFTSSGAATTAYATWGAYGATKAALNHLALTLANEEPEVVTLSVKPGVVDTHMQVSIREVHQERMDEKDRKKFLGLKEDGGLLRPEQPGRVMARLALDAPKSLSGKFISWNAPELAAFQDP